MKLTFDTVSKIEFDDKIAEIRSRPEYVHLRTGIRDFIEGLRERLKEWLMDLLERAFSNIPDAPAISGQASTIFLVAGILLIMAIIIFIAVKAGKTLERNKKIKEILGEKIDGRVTTASLKTKASEYGKDGQYRLAIRYGYIALLLLMHEKDILYLEDTKTNHEILQTLKKSSFPMLPAFQQLAGMFNASWYGYKAYSKETYESWNDSMNLIWNRVTVNEEKS
ncbi:MAG: hypothetical protein A2Y21_06580 [Clostridiales bacterium GWC2_40_7]|nr:MAG: hypothetical protein A2Y21_06580 [Clostridiales bacterium GWC2_40_7]